MCESSYGTLKLLEISLLKRIKRLFLMIFYEFEALEAFIIKDSISSPRLDSQIFHHCFRRDTC